jgi:preprotein translocase SecE subunit
MAYSLRVGFLGQGRTKVVAQKRKSPRVRKAAPSVREKIASESQRSAIKPKSRRQVVGKGLAPLVLAWQSLRIVLRPLAPVARPLWRLLKWLAPSYFVNSWRELRQVTWPNRRETWRLTLAVFVFAVVFGALVAVVDLGLDKLFKEVVLR